MNGFIAPQNQQQQAAQAQKQ